MVTIDSAEQVWQSPDGRKVMFRVVTSEGKVFKTWSKTIGKEGWSGEVEEYEKDGEKFIKQPYSASAGRGSGTKSFKADPVKLEQDLKLEIARNQSIQRQVALKAAVDVYTASGISQYTPDTAQEYIKGHFDYFMKLLNPKLGGEHADDQGAD